MKNWEKYEKTLKELGFEDFAISNGNVRICANISCADCRFNIGACGDEKIRWLYYEANRPKITKKARKFLEFIECGCIARDKNGEIFWFESESLYRCDNHWTVNGGKFRNLSAMCVEKEFDFITWDSEPWNVEELLKLEVENEY